VTEKSRVEALQLRVTEQIERIQSGEDWRMLDFAGRFRRQPATAFPSRANRSPSRDTAIEAGVPNVAIGA
jgi:hypothetical protein